MSLNNQIFVGKFTPKDCPALAGYDVGSAHTATATFLGDDILNGNLQSKMPMGLGVGAGQEASGIIVYMNLTAIGNGVDTVQLVLEEQDPTSGVWMQVAATTATAALVSGNMIKLKVKDAVASVAASATGVTVQDKLPEIWRVRVIHSGASSFTYSIGIELYC